MPGHVPVALVRAKYIIMLLHADELISIIYLMIDQIDRSLILMIFLIDCK